ncbi:hypothetical protein GLA29479_1896 [Lysobacter antibioticus]|nr:hypothetical protein GLA29479_1896 [Lysobacter antibioticus]
MSLDGLDPLLGRGVARNQGNVAVLEALLLEIGDQSVSEDVEAHPFWNPRSAMLAVNWRLKHSP